MSHTDMKEFLLQIPDDTKRLTYIQNADSIPTDYCIRIVTLYPTAFYTFLDTMKRYVVPNVMLCLSNNLLRFQCFLNDKQVAINGIFGNDTFSFDTVLHNHRVYGNYASTMLKSLAFITPLTSSNLTFEVNTNGNLVYSVESLDESLKDTLELEASQSLCTELNLPEYTNMQSITTHSFKRILKAMPNVFSIETKGNMLRFQGKSSTCTIQLHMYTQEMSSDAEVVVLKRDVQVCLAFAKHTNIVHLCISPGKPLCCIFPSIFQSETSPNQWNSTRVEVYVQPYCSGAMLHF